LTQLPFISTISYPPLEAAYSQHWIVVPQSSSASHTAYPLPCRVANQTIQVTPCSSLFNQHYSDTILSKYQFSSYQFDLNSSWI
jgi:hypothetical protein